MNQLLEPKHTKKWLVKQSIVGKEQTDELNKTHSAVKLSYQLEFYA